MNRGARLLLLAAGGYALYKLIGGQGMQVMRMPANWDRYQRPNKN